MRRIIGGLVVLVLAIGAWFFVGGGAENICLKSITSGQNNALTDLACNVTGRAVTNQ